MRTCVRDVTAQRPNAFWLRTHVHIKMAKSFVQIHSNLTDDRISKIVGDQVARKKKLTNHSPYPDHVIEKIARCFWPDIQADFESYEAQQEFAAWKANRERQTGIDKEPKPIYQIAA